MTFVLNNFRICLFLWARPEIEANISLMIVTTSYQETLRRLLSAELAQLGSQCSAVQPVLNSVDLRLDITTELEVSPHYISMAS